MENGWMGDGVTDPSGQMLFCDVVADRKSSKLDWLAEGRVTYLSGLRTLQGRAIRVPLISGQGLQFSSTLRRCRGQWKCCLNSHLRSKCPRGSKGDKHWAPSGNSGRCHADGVGHIEGRTLQARLRNKPCTAAIHVHTFRVDENRPRLIRSKSKCQHGRNWTVHRVQISTMILAAATFPPVSILESCGWDSKTILPLSLEGPGPEL